MKNSIYTLTGVMAFLLLFSCNNSAPKTENETAKTETTTSVAKQNRL